MSLFLVQFIRHLIQNIIYLYITYSNIALNKALFTAIFSHMIR